MEELGVDMEELESRLYGQVFHSSMENEEPPPHHEFQPNSNNNFRRPSRYFNLKTKAPKEKPQEFISLTSDNPVPEDLSSCPESEVFAGRYYDGISTVPQKLIRMIAPCNNIVVLPQVSTQIISQEVLPSVRSTNYEKYVSREHIRELKRIKKNEKNRRRREIRKQLKKLHLQEKEASKVQQEFLSNTVFLEHNMVTNTLSLEPERNDIITLSDSDVSDCVEIPERKELVVLSSDDENGINIKQEDGTNLRLKNIKTEVNLPDDYKLKNDDDVIFIEPEAKQIEVIEIDCDSINVSLKDDEKHSETTSTNSDNIKIPNIPSKRRLVAKELRELRTPDSSASNDFLDNTVDLNQSKFNFSLHGSDFRNTNTSKTKNVEVSETDSTTSDVTTAKANFFNVVEFETAPKHFFEDTNLETFGKYITPKRNNLKNVKDLNLEQVCTRASQCHIITAHDSSGSSSESDYDENKVSYLNSKRLPELSTVHIETELVDRDDSFVAEEISVEPKQMLKKNDAKRKSEDNDASNKKRKVQEDGANGNEDVTTVENVEQQLDCFTDDIEIGDHSDFIIIDETDDHDHIVENVSDDTGSYFSCDEFNNITSDLMLGNCRAEEYGNGDLKIDKTDYLNYSIEKIHRTMSDDPDLWKILDVDRLHFRYATPRGPRCHRCREVGHMALHCTNKQGRPACTLCGERTHAEPRCPMAMCTSCGRLGGHTTYCSYCAHWRNVQCNICKLYGHVDSVCPDAWRRYHLTTKPGPIVKPAVQTLKAEKDRWCSGCAQSGHFESACTHYNRTHYAVYPEVLHYVDLYNFPKLRPYIIHREDATSSDISSGKAKSLCTVKSSDQFMDVRDTDQDQTPFEDSFHDAETGSPDKRLSVDEQLKIEDSAVNEMYFTISFPPPNFIPAYFRCQMNYLKKQYLRNHKTLGNRVDTKNSADSLRDATSSSTRSGTSASLEEFIPLDNNNQVSQTNDASNRSEAKENYKIKGGPSVNQRKSGCNQSLKLDYLQFAYIHTDQGIHFFNNIRRKPGVHLIIEKYDETPAGEIYINGYSEANVVSIKKDIVQFLRSMPCINNLPQESKDMLQFLLRHKEMLDKAEGNCWTLCKKLCKLTNSGGRDGCTSSLVKLKINIQVTIQLLLFGKLKLENGGQHVNKIQEWIRTTRDRPNYIIPLNNIFEIYDSYSYLFEPRKSIFPYKHLCAQHDHYILPTNNSKRQKMPQRNRTYVENKSKFVMETCKKFNLPNKFMAELVAIQNAMQASKHSRTYYIDFLKFMSRFRKYMKKHKIL